MGSIKRNVASIVVGKYKKVLLVFNIMMSTFIIAMLVVNLSPYAVLQLKIKKGVDKLEIKNNLVLNDTDEYSKNNLIKSLDYMPDQVADFIICSNSSIDMYWVEDKDISIYASSYDKINSDVLYNIENKDENIGYDGMTLATQNLLGFISKIDILLNGNQQDVITCVHEYSHAYDFINGMPSESDEFLNLYNNIIKSNVDLFNVKDDQFMYDYFNNSINEFFAESLATYLLERETESNFKSAIDSKEASDLWKYFDSLNIVTTPLNN
jgi:hypothetical protein